MDEERTSVETGSCQLHLVERRESCRVAVWLGEVLWRLLCSGAVVGRCVLLDLTLGLGEM